MADHTSPADLKDRIAVWLASIAGLMSVISALQAAGFWLEHAPSVALQAATWTSKGGLVLVLLLMLRDLLRLSGLPTDAARHEEDGVMMGVLLRAALIAFVGTIVVLRLDNTLTRVLPSESVRLMTLIVTAWMLGLFSLCFLILHMRLGRDALKG